MRSDNVSRGLATLTTALCVSLLSGCTATRPAKGETAAKLAETCRAYGFRPKTDQFAACVFELDQNRIAQNRSRARAVAAAFSDFGDDMQASAARQQAAAAANRPVNCTSTPGMNGVVKTTCY